MVQVFLYPPTLSKPLQRGLPIETFKKEERRKILASISCSYIEKLEHTGKE